MWPNLQETTDLVTFTEEIFNEKLRFLCSGITVPSFIIARYVQQILGRSPIRKQSREDPFWIG